MVVDPINHWFEHGPGGGGIQPAHANQPVSLTERSHVNDDTPISSNGMDAAHGLAVADSRMDGGVVVRGIDVDKANPALAPIPAA
jgi:hypothetical protein